MEAVTARPAAVTAGRRRALVPSLLVAGLASAATACGVVDRWLADLEGRTPHERYAAALHDAGLDETALGRAWRVAAETALRSPIAIAPPYRESGFFAAERPDAVGYGLTLRRGEELQVEVRAETDSTARLFVDLFSAARSSAADPASGSGSPLRHRASLDTLPGRLEHVAEEESDVVIRLQPELLSSVRYTVSLVRGPSLAFPVSGVEEEAMRSFFGDPRQAGRRVHEGVDIFAPRGTPALAAAEGRVRVGSNRLGGRVVWIRDAARSQTLYYAHLDTQLVQNGSRVRRGDTLGLVGNTGNARTTPPHLHFAVYARGEGAVDPVPFIRSQPRRPPEPAADTSSLGEPGRTTGRARLRAAAGREAPERALLEPATFVERWGVAGEWYRVRLPDGRPGFVHHTLVESTSRALDRLPVVAARPLRERPSARALVVDSVAAGAVLPVRASFGRFRLVDTPAGRRGWIGAPDDPG